MAATSTNFVTSFLAALEGKMADIATAVANKGKDIGSDITAAEDVAGAVVGTLAASGNAVAVSVEAVMPFAEGIIAAAEKAFGVAPKTP